VLTPLQQRLLDIVSRLPEADGFALAGGAALILRGTVDRDTNDLDFFIGHADVEVDTIATMVAAVERALSGAGIEWRREVTTDTFARLTVETELEECRIDLAVDVRMGPVDRDPRVALSSIGSMPMISISLGRLTSSCGARSLPGPSRSAVADETAVVGETAAATETGRWRPR
jgi:hypothetical protein